ncbi:xylitol dehydrogenase [Salpingoeca rosetta]|uniref:Xylitol dehydrogenase n=1 Tax=Salpingoeca rosetta (strain ATCC 50818 / BSB-021) TaxID=946362 RepID=F2UBV3_SALR5|nr:xylitol dehydrogenase [Salpingoeca rosetta]EGD73969.1 xylitol dehydrogenase [Salpingoeca rosetta]|eukprot:XP_004993532.1 xylitol dehydrogenase [Salpingoeca rosetta]
MALLRSAAAAAGAVAAAAACVRPVTVAARRTAMTRALVLNKVDDLELREIDVDEPFTDDDVRIDIHKVGICGSDIHYYEHGSIPPFYVNEPMILGHEASGIVTEVGKNVTHLKVGDRVCMEPGVPDFRSDITLAGKYNLDPNVRFWATPPADYATQINGAGSPWKAGHGCLRPSVVHPGAFTFKLPDNVPLEVGALVEPLSVGMHAATKAQIRPGATAAVLGAGPIGMVTVLSALAAGCSRVLVSDLSPAKLSIAESLAPGKVKAFPAAGGSEIDEMKAHLGGKGADVVFECAGHHDVAANAVKLAGIGGRVILIGCAAQPVPLDVGLMLTKELTMMGIFRYAGVYPAAINLLSSGAIDLTPIISKHWTFDQSVEAFDFARNAPPDVVKNVIHVRNDAE